MNTKVFCPCGRGSNLILGTGMENQIFVYRMGRLCGAHEIWVGGWRVLGVGGWWWGR